MQKLSSLKNNYTYQLLIILATILTQTCRFMVKRIPRCFNIFARKNTKYYVSLLIPYIESSLSRGHQTVARMKIKVCYLYMPRIMTGTQGEHLAT